MKKPNYQDFIIEAEEIAMKKKSKPIAYTISIIFSVIYIFLYLKLIEHWNDLGFSSRDIKGLALIMIILLLVINSILVFIEYKVTVSREQISFCLKKLVLKKEDEYLEEMNNCSDYLQSIRESINLVKGELEIAKNNCAMLGDEYLSDIKECTDRLKVLNKLLPGSESEFELAKSNLKEFSAVKKVVEQWWK